MEHNPFITFTDGTTITYSDIKKKNDSEYITIYFETPDEINGFNSAQINYPNGEIENVLGYDEYDISNIVLYHYNKIGALAFEFAKELYIDKSLKP